MKLLYRKYLLNVDESLHNRNEGRSPNDLDLHGLHVDEAIDTLRSVLDQLQNERTGPRHLTVITGRGK